MKHPGLGKFRRSVMFALLVVSTAVMAQHIRGALEGTVVDQNGAVLSGAKVIVKNEATSAESSTTANDRGYFNVQNLEAGIYTVTVEQSGFRKYVAKDVNIKVGAVTPLNISLQIGATEQTVEVTATSTEAVVDTSRATVDGVIMAKTIENLPLNGRNFLDLAQLEPGVQVRDGGDFDPTKNQMVGVSIGGRSGRSTRIQVDGVDITDETVGTTTTNISNETIQEFQVSRSSLDPSTDLTSSGAINIVTRSGGNSVHGSGFSFFRDARFAADIRTDKTSPSPEKPPFDREQGGGNAGGYFIKDKWFWHVEYEHNNQDGQQFTAIPAFPQFNGAFSVPLDEHTGGARTDYNITQNLKAFYRFGYNYNFGVTGFGLNSLSSFANLNNTNNHVAGLDYSTAHWTHSGRFSYLNFNNFIVDANSAAGTPDTLAPDGTPLLVNISGVLTVGPNLLAPQKTFQDNKQSKYDASYAFRNHIFRFGASYNKIDEAVFASFFGLAPRVSASRNATTIAAADTFGGSNDPLNFPLSSIVLGNGLGAFSERPALGFPDGGTTNHRLGFYFTDAWKIKHNITLNYGLRYDYDSALSDSDLARTALLAQFNPALAGKPNNDTNNFAPQLGLAWDVRSDGKFVIRAGAGVYYDTNIINNFLFDRVLNLPPGLGNDTPSLSGSNPKLLDPGTGACLFDITHFNPAPGQCSGGANLVGQPLKNSIAAANLMQNTLQQVTAQLATNFSLNGTPLFDQTLDTEGSVIFNKYKRPYSVMFNIGFQNELRPGLVLSVDYLRNHGVHFNQTTDLNRLGAANTLNAATARSAIGMTADNFALANKKTPCAGMIGSTAIDCVIANGGTISDFAANGLGSGSAVDGFAFQGLNPKFRGMGFIQSLGLSTYSALTVNLRGRLGGFGPLKNMTGNLSYALSRFDSTGGDQEFLSGSAFNDAPTKFYGPAGLDRTHQFSMGLLVDLPFKFKLSTTTRIASALSQSAFLSCTDCGAAEIFLSDLDGDGVTQDPLPGTNRGSFGRDVKDGKALNSLITAFNQQISSGTLTPAGQALVSAGLFTPAQLQALGAVYNGGGPIALAPANQVGLDSLINTDIRLAWVYKLKERVEFQPTVDVFNLFNIANFDTPGNRLGSSLDGSPGSINGTSPDLRSNRYGLGSGSFAPGIPRAFQFGIRVSF
ncbi:MAG: TonB-dependent receptor [Chloracidobacterium sp.]|nr:TonB-dependent receptor [Chloracidobacterium sp.]